MSILWKPTIEQINQSQIHQFANYIADQYHTAFSSYKDFHHWSVQYPEDFWDAWWRFAEIIAHRPYSKVLECGEHFWSAKWFVDAKLNFAENLLRFRDQHTAIVFVNEQGIQRRMSYQALFKEVACLTAYLREIGLQAGDRVAGYLPNMPEAIVAMLATTAIGAVWSSTSPDFGEKGVLDRFGQIEPKVLFTVDGYYYNGKAISILDKVERICANLPSLEQVIMIDYLHPGQSYKQDGRENYSLIQRNESVVEIDFTAVLADHPLCILYSSGTTGLPKTIVHRTAGVLIQHLKEHRLHTDLKREDVLFYFTTTGWMMWNWLASGLATGCSIVCYDGSPTYPDAMRLWRLIDELGITVFGTSAKYLTTMQDQKIEPQQQTKLHSLRAILSTGSVLPDHCFDYVYQKIKSNIMLASISGGTDIISCFALGNPALPVRRGELQSIGLGMDVQAWNEKGQSVIDEQGELVCVKPFPSMPLGFWNDEQQQKYIASYFSHFPNIWYHGDFIHIYSHGGIRFLGRSDAILNPGGVRIGTAEIYTVVEAMEEIADSLVIGQHWQDDERILLFVQLNVGYELNQNLIDKIKQTIRQQCTPRHIPAKVIAVKDIPYTLNGKKVELAVKQIIHGEEVKNKTVLRNPQALEQFALFNIAE